MILKLFKPQIVLVYAAVLSVMLIAISMSATGYLAVWTMIAVGLCNSVMFAIIFSLSVRSLGGYTMQASGLLSTAIVGGAIVPYLQGVLIDQYGWSVSFLLPLLCYAYIVFFGLSGYKSSRVTNSS